MQPKIAFLATGDEIVEGDVINTSTPAIAKLLKPLGVSFGSQMASDDNQDHIENALRELLKNHAAVIITGGLGPTCDDRTRFAVANVAKKPLILNHASWDRVYNYIYQLRNFVPENNKQQCLFPKDSTILNNALGTADGCHIQIKATHPEKIHSDYQHIFMLPGPPSQALPIVANDLLPFFKHSNFAKDTFRHSWMLLSASESHLAQQIEQALEEDHQGIHIGYRYAPPYLQVKLAADTQQLFEKAFQLIVPILTPHLWRNGSQDAIELLSNLILSSDKIWYIEDFITQGRFQTAILNLQTLKQLRFPPSQALPQTDYHITIQADQNNSFETLKPGMKKTAFSWSMRLLSPNDNIVTSFEHTLTPNEQCFNILSHHIAIELLQQIALLSEKSA
jgi:molybdopterin-biosynthesis enzyme MoeA-like protein